MIATRVLPRTASRSKVENISKTARYILGLDANEKDTTEKVTYWGSFNCDTISRESRELLVKEMVDLSMYKPKSENPCDHFVMSLKEGERPEPKQADEAVMIALMYLGMSDCKVVYGVHENTENAHIHILINRVNPKTIKINKRGFWKLALGKALATIEHVQGWKPERMAMFKVLENGTLGIREIKNNRIEYISTGELPKIPSQGKPKDSVEIAARSGFREAINKARSWEELQANLNEIGGTLYTKGSGAVILVRETGEWIKASDVGKECSGKKLQGRFKREAPPEYKIVQDPPQDRPRKSPAAAAGEAHRMVKSAFTIAIEKGFGDAIRGAKTWEEAQAKLNEIGGALYTKGSGAVIFVEETQKYIKCSSIGRDCSYMALEKRFGEPAPEHFSISHRKNIEDAPPIKEPIGLAPSQIPNWEAYVEADRSLKKDQNARRTELKDRHRREKEEASEAAGGRPAEAAKPQGLETQTGPAADERKAPLPNIRARQQAESRGLTEAFNKERSDLEALRPRPPEGKTEKINLVLSGPPTPTPQTEPPRPTGLEAYTRKKVGPDYHYTQDKPVKRTAFIDSGQSISVLSTEKDDILAALLLAQSKWGENVVAKGDPEFVKKAVNIALDHPEHKINLTNPEFKEEKARRAAAAAQREAAREPQEQQQQPQAPQPEIRPSGEAQPPQESSEPLPIPLRNYTSMDVGADKHYFPPNEPSQQAAFIYTSEKISVIRETRDDILAALQLAQIKWPQGIIVYGDAAFVKRAINIALDHPEHEINITNPEVQEEKARRAAERERERAAAAQDQQQANPPETTHIALSSPFASTGQEIRIIGETDDDIIAALKSAKLEWGEEIVVLGGPEISKRIAKIAIQEGIEMADPFNIEEKAISDARIGRVKNLPMSANVPYILSDVSAIIQQYPDRDMITDQKLAREIAQVLLIYGPGGNDVNNPKGLLSMSQAELDLLSLGIYEAAEKRIARKAILGIISKIEVNLNSPEMVAATIKRRAQESSTSTYSQTHNRTH